MIIIYIIFAVILFVILIEALNYWFAPIKNGNGIIAQKVYTVGYGYNSMRKWVQKPENDSWKLVIDVDGYRGSFPLSKEDYKLFYAQEKVLCKYKVARLWRSIRIVAIEV